MISSEHISHSLRTQLTQLVDSRPVAWWLSSSVQIELEAIRISYAELLFRWGKTLDRVEVVKLFRMARVRHPNAFALSIMQPGTDSHGLGTTSFPLTRPER